MACLLYSCSGDKKNNFNGSDITKAKINGNFSLTDQYGKNITLTDFKGNVVAIFFGFANCPDIWTIGKAKKDCNNIPLKIS